MYATSGTDTANNIGSDDALFLGESLLLRAGDPVDWDGDGNLCVGGAIGRFVGAGEIQNSGAAGVISLDVDLTVLPQPLGPVSVQPGQTWNFQAWHRDTATGPMGSNLTRGFAVNFQ